MISVRIGLLAATSIAALATCAAAGAAGAATDNTPVRALQISHDRGLSAASQPVMITIHLVPADVAAFHAAVDALYNPASPTFHHWMTNADLARYAPPASHMAAVRASLERQGLTVVSTDVNGFSIRARGALGTVAKAFRTEIHDFDRNSVVFRANTRNAALAGVPSEYVSAVAGIESHPMHPMLTRLVDPKTDKPIPNVPVSQITAPDGLDSLITPIALTPAQTITFTTPNAPLPTATYSGVIYDSDPTKKVDFSARMLQRVYGLDAAYRQSIDGAGQTIVLLEAFGYGKAEADANTAARLNHLPSFDSTNFKVVYPQGRPADPKLGVLVGWDQEIALDIQSAHAIAPGAKILIVASNGQSEDDFEAAMQTITDQSLGYSVSDSWEEDADLLAGASEQEAFEDILVLAAAKGISFQFSTGDGGDASVGSPLGAPGVPSVCPHAVAVGGTAILNTLDGGGFYPVGWGSSIVPLFEAQPINPAENLFIYGGGGGESVFWPKPAWQSALPGVGRQEPDISALADPHTGFPVVLSVGGTQMLMRGFGGTSLAAPIFSAFWALANQTAGHPLGQASPTIANLTTGVTDVVAVSSPDNVSGTYTDASGSIFYSTDKLFKYLIPSGQPFIAALYNNPPGGEALAVGFALDLSLTVTKGWDNATGYGTPDGLKFIKAAAAYGQK